MCVIFAPRIGAYRRIVKSQSRECFHASKGVSYSTLRDEFKKFVKPFVDDIALYSTHSIKSGAASNPTCWNVSADMLDMHAGWKYATSKNRYIKHIVSDRLKVAQSIAISRFSFVYYNYLVYCQTWRGT